jgi:amidohydrolase
MDIRQEIQKISEKYLDDITKVRRHLHQNPELSYQEFETSKFIQKKLDEHGIPYKAGYVKTGIVAKIEGQHPTSRVIALRGDMDALPVKESTDLPFASVNEGIMHACGHDVHTSSVLGTALILNALKEQFEGTVLIIFQPAEEKLPGGAKLMMEEGALDNPKPELVIGQHIMPDMPVGKVGFKAGMYMASTDEIYLTIRGKGGHAAMPHQLTDNVLITSHIIVALQQIVSRNAKASVPTVLSFGKVIADGATNVIPSEIKVEGTFRTMNEEWRTEAHKKIKRVAKFTAQAMGADCDVEIKKGYPFLVNDDKITATAVGFAKAFLGHEQVEELELRMTAEDFAYFSQEYPSTFYRLGVKPPGLENPAPLHASNMIVDEAALKTGMETMAYLAISFLTS